MRTDADRLLSSWSGSPTPAKAVALCDVLRASLSGDASLRTRVSQIGPAIVGRHDSEPEVLLALGRLYLAAEELLRADAVLKRALELTPADARPLRLLGEVFLAAGNARDAEKAFEGAIARGLGDRETAAWLGRARSYVALQDTEGSSAVAAAIARGLWSPVESGGEGALRVHRRIEEEQTTTAPGLQSTGPMFEVAVAARGGPSSISDFDVTAPREVKPDIAALARSGPALPSPDSARTLVHPRPAGMEVPHPKPTLRSALLQEDEPEPATAARREPTPPRNDVGSVLDEMSMQIDALDWDGEQMPQSGREMERYLESLRSREGLVIDEVTRMGSRSEPPGGRNPMLEAVEGVAPPTPTSDRGARVMAMPAQPLPALGIGNTIVMEGVRRDEVEVAPTDRHPTATPRMPDAPPVALGRGGSRGAASPSPTGGTVPMPNALVRATGTDPMFGGLPALPSVAVGAQSVAPSPAVLAGGDVQAPAAPAGAWSTPPQTVEVAVPRRRSARSPLVPLLFAAVVVVVVALSVFYGWLKMRGGAPAGTGGALHADRVAKLA